MPVINVVRPNLFRDSIQLMRLTEDVKKLEGIDDAVVAMGTDTNKRLLQELGLLAAEGESAGDADLMMAVRFAKGAKVAELADRVQEMVMNPPASPGAPSNPVMHSVRSALQNLPGANIAIVSVPGGQAFEPSMDLLKNGINVHLFSDHVPTNQELQLKKYAHANGLLLLGPGAGTSIIGGIGLGFANSVRRGDVGIVASAGTGIQEVSTMLDGIGLGVSAALGVGGSDVSEEVGGLMTKDSLDLLERDKATRAIMIVAKTPKKAIMERVMRHAEKRTTKPVIACFLGLDIPPTVGDRITYAKTLHSAVQKMAWISGDLAIKRFTKEISISYEDLLEITKSIGAGLGSGRRYIRGLYSGGTLAHESLLIFKELVGEAYSNTPLTDKFLLEDPNKSRGNSVVDLGDEFFTSGRAHPMIDPTLRKLRITQEGKDPFLAAVLLDLVLGYGSSPDPGGALQGAIRDLTQMKSGPVVMAHVCGSRSDPQNFEDQSAKLTSAGAILFRSNALLSVASALLVGGDRAASNLKNKWEGLLA